MVTIVNDPIPITTHKNLQFRYNKLHWSSNSSLRLGETGIIIKTISAENTHSPLSHILRYINKK